MRKFTKSACVFLIAFLTSGIIAYEFPTYTLQKKNSALYTSSSLLEFHNQERLRYGKSKLSIDGNLTSAAQMHADWMSKNKTLSHKGENGSSIKDRVGSGYIVYGENIAYGQKSEKEVFRAWMNSSGHKKNILNSYFKRVGFGSHRSESGVLYWCVVFGA
jgi:uncharacterized protein YkwD